MLRSDVKIELVCHSILTYAGMLKQSTCVAAVDRKLRLHPQQEMELVEYIRGLTRKGLAPTRPMIRNFASSIAGKRLGHNWAARFIERNQHNLSYKWTKGIDSNRHRADSEAKYKLYFDLLHSKIEEYSIEL